MADVKLGKEYIIDFKDHVVKKNATLLDQIQVQASIAQMSLFDIHARAVGCLCECLGMNAENSIAACAGRIPPYNSAAYFQTMQKWEIANEKGGPTI